MVESFPIDRAWTALRRPALPRRTAPSQSGGLLGGIPAAPFHGQRVRLVVADRLVQLGLLGDGLARRRLRRRRRSVFLALGGGDGWLRRRWRVVERDGRLLLVRESLAHR